MELRHMRTIVAVARHRSFTKAAAELFLAQSAISQQVSRLEAEIGIQIFRRSSRSVELTEEGKVILDHAKRVLAEVDDLQVAIHMVEDAVDEVLAMLRSDDLDGAFASVDPDAIRPEFSATLLWEEEFVVAAAPDHAFAGRPDVTFEELVDQDRIACGRSGRSRSPGRSRSSGGPTAASRPPPRLSWRWRSSARSSPRAR